MAPLAAVLAALLPSACPAPITPSMFCISVGAIESSKAYERPRPCLPHRRDEAILPGGGR